MKRDHCVCSVEISPDEIDAGADITLVVRVECPPEDSLRGPRVSIRDHDNTELASAELTKSDDGAYEADDIVVVAPRTAGEHVYRAVVLAADKDGALQEQTAAEVRFIVTPHAAHLNVWDIPSAVAAGERFKFTVGVKCSAGCDLGGRRLSIVSHDGSPARAASLGNEIWPGTDALYFAEVDVEAPPAVGNYAWEIRTTEWDLELPHAPGSVALALRVVSPPDCQITVVVVDREQQTPIAGATVVMHPYRARTGENGVATLKVTKGHYDIQVGGPKYLSACITAEVTADMATRVELEVDIPLELPDEV